LSFAVDVNVLLYASDRASPFSPKAVAFLNRCASDGETFCLAWTTLMSYLRLATHPAVFASPLSPEEAAENVDGLLRLDHLRVLSEEEGFWKIYREVTRDLPVRGNLVSDAHLASLLRQHEVTTLYTNDRDFVRFAFLRVRNPFEGVKA
jgi:toxin-antitoxin system PIN domain toxin